jgi:hypothetical protein
LAETTRPARDGIREDQICWFLHSLRNAIEVSIDGKIQYEGPINQNSKRCFTTPYQGLLILHDMNP